MRLLELVYNRYNKTELQIYVIVLTKILHLINIDFQDILYVVNIFFRFHAIFRIFVYE